MKKRKISPILIVALFLLQAFVWGSVCVSEAANIFSAPKTQYRSKTPAKTKKARAEKKSAASGRIKKEVELTKPSLLDMPSEYGTIMEIWQPMIEGKPLKPSIETPLIVHLQDAHANIQAQKKEADILDHIIKTYKIYVILVEGGITDKDFSYLRDQFTPEERKKKADKLLNEGTITAESYIDIASDYPLKFQGIEDRELYEANMEAFLKVERFREGGLEVLKKLKAACDVLKPAVYPQALNELESLRLNYEGEQIKLSEFVLRLSESAGKFNADLSVFPNLEALTAVSQLEPKIDFKKVEAERKALVEKLTKQLSKNELSGLLSRSMDFKNKKVGQGDYHAYLVETAKKAGVHPGEFAQVADYALYASKNEAIDSRSLINEIDKAYRETAQSITKKEIEKQFFNICENLRLLDKFVELKLTPDEFSAYKAGKSEFNIEAWPDRLKEIAKKYRVKIPALPDTSVIQRNLPNLEDFYESSFKRDQAFIRNSLKKFKKEDHDKGILICGGFHTPNLTRLFKENNIAYAVVAPKVEESTDEKFYREKLIEGYESRLWDELAPSE